MGCLCPRSPTPVLANGVDCLGFATSMAQYHWYLVHDQSFFFGVVAQMLRFCRAMHSASILHMDIKPDNWLLVRRPRSEVDRTEEMEHAGGIDHSMSLIDFGRAIDLSVFPQDGSDKAFMGQCCAPSFSCPAMREVCVLHRVALFNPFTSAVCPFPFIAPSLKCSMSTLTHDNVFSDERRAWLGSMMPICTL